jgi:FKBP-type peptidyl-prolyl cis-trans isomerase
MLVKVTVNYVGCLTNGKVFDQGKSYEFQLGKILTELSSVIFFCSYCC